MIAIVDYGSGNILAIANILKKLKLPFVVTGDHDNLVLAERYILPGVGSFDATMGHLKHSGLINLLNDQVQSFKKKFLGICVGMQILGNSSEEGDLPGLGWVPGQVKKIDISLNSSRLRLPHMGWNSIVVLRESAIFNCVDTQRGFYFLHNYYLDTQDKTDTIALVDHGKEFPCAVSRDNVYGVQFHPEKSHANGLAVLRNFATI